MMEHMHSKGLRQDWNVRLSRREAAEVETAYAAYRAERIKSGAEPEKVVELEKVWKDAIARAGACCQGRFRRDCQGGVGLNAFTTYDAVTLTPCRSTALNCGLISSPNASPIR